MSPSRKPLPAYVGPDHGWCHRCRNFFVDTPPKKFAGVIDGADRRRSYEGSVLCIECEEAIEEAEANR